MADRMMLRCKDCGKEFASSIQMDRHSLETATLEHNSEKCPHCGQSASYNKPDYFFSEN